MQGLTEFNPASHLVWLVGGAIWILLVIAFLLEAYDWILGRLWTNNHQDDAEIER